MGPKASRTAHVGTPAPASSSSLRIERIIVGVSAALLALYAVWRITLGASLSDDGHVVALALRLAQGGIPFVDEMNVQILGSLWAAPFAWAWTHLFGITGLVLASRAYYVLIAFTVGYACYRALRPSFGPLLSALGVIVPLLAPPYNILSISYNTSAILGVMLATCAAFAAYRDSRRGWAFTSGVAIAVASISYPPMTLAAIAFLASFFWLARGRRDLVVATMIGGAIVAIPFVIWLAFFVGPTPISNTLEFTREYIRLRSHPLTKTGAVLSAYGLALFGPLMLAAIALSVVATMERFSGRARAIALALLPLAAVLPAVWHLATGGDYKYFGVLGSAYLLMLLLWMLVPVVVRLLRADPTTEPPGHAAVRKLFVLTAPLAVVGIPVVGFTTSSNSWFGMPVVGAAPLIIATVIGWGLLILADRPSVLPRAAALLVGVLIVLLTITPFRNPWPWKLTSHIRSGAFAGISALPEKAGQVNALTVAGRRWVPKGGKVLFMGAPGGYLLVDAKPDTNVEWLAAFGPPNRWSLRWLQTRGGPPDTIFIAGEYLQQRGTWVKLGQWDPLVAWTRANYRVVGRAGGWFVFVRR